MKTINNLLNDRKKRPPKPASFDGLPIRQSIKQTRGFVDNEYIEREYLAIFPHSVTTVYNILIKHANHKEQTCFPSITTIMKLGGIKNRNTACKAIKILEAFSIIFVSHSRGHKVNQYALLDPSVWKPPDRNIVDTIKKTKKGNSTVSKNTYQQWHR